MRTEVTAHQQGRALRQISPHAPQRAISGITQTGKRASQHLPVDEQNEEVDGLEVGNRGVPTAQQAPGQRHQPVAWRVQKELRTRDIVAREAFTPDHKGHRRTIKDVPEDSADAAIIAGNRGQKTLSQRELTGVVDLARGAPPAGGQQLGAALGLQELQVRHLHRAIMKNKILSTPTGRFKAGAPEIHGQHSLLRSHHNTSAHSLRSCTAPDSTGSLVHNGD
jgi:hypothetical protein